MMDKTNQSDQTENFEPTLYEGFKDIRRFCNRYDIRSVIEACITCLHRDPKVEVLKSYPPWGVLLILKWALIYGNPRKKRKPITHSEFNQVVNLYHDLTNSTDPLSSYSTPFLFLRNVAYQQFWLQENLTAHNLARQHFLFQREEPNHMFNNWFRENYRINLNQFLSLEFGLLVWTLQENSLEIRNSYFELVDHEVTPHEINAFLSAISDTIEGHQKNLSSTTQRTKIQFQIYEKSPLRRKPLITLENERHIVISRQVLSHFLTNGVYEMLRSINPSKFMDRFGPIFEGYVRKVLRYSGINFDDSKTVSQYCPNKSVDFVIRDSTETVYLDAKGVEMAYLGQVGYDPNIISEKVKTSVLKGAEQCFETKLAYSKQAGVPKSAEHFAIIVTFKELYLGSGCQFFSTVGKEFYESACSKYHDDALIPYQNFFIIDITELEFLCEIIKTTGIGIGTILRKAREDSLSPSSEKLTFGQHLEAFSRERIFPQFLKECFDVRIAEFQKRIRSRNWKIRKPR